MPVSRTHLRPSVRSQLKATSYLPFKDYGVETYSKMGWDRLKKVAALPRELQNRVGEAMHNNRFDLDAWAYAVLHWLDLFMEDPMLSRRPGKKAYEDLVNRFLWSTGENGDPLGMFITFPDLHPFSFIRNNSSDAGLKAVRQFNMNSTPFLTKPRALRF